ncbi:MAG: hypothetical protein AAF479_17955 [Pseudomonadota bacterium]
MATTRQTTVELLESLLAFAKEGKLGHFAYHYEVDGTSNWGFQNVTDHGQLVISARLAALAIEKDS